MDKLQSVWMDLSIVCREVCVNCVASTIMDDGSWVVELGCWVCAGSVSLTNTWTSVVFWSGEAKNLWVKWCFCDLGGNSSSSTLVFFARGGVKSISSDSSDLDWDELGEFGVLDEEGRLDDDIMWW